MAAKKDGVSSEFIKGVGGAVGAAVCLWIGSLYAPFWKWFSGSLQTGWSHLMASSQYPNWSAYLVSLLAAISLLRRALRAWRSRTESTSRFKQLSFMGSVWRWNSISHHPSALMAYCPHCDTALVYAHYLDAYDRHRVRWRCQRCDLVCTDDSGDKDDLNGRVSREIDRLIRTSEWRKHLPDSLPK